MQQKLPLPDAIQNAPELYLGLDIYLEAFLNLDTCRQNGIELGDITWLMIEEYCDRCGFDSDQREDCHYFIKDMDEAYLKHIASKKSKTKQKPNG